MKKPKASFTILCLFICLSIIGVALIPSLNVQLTPNRSSQEMSIGFQWRNTSARVIEKEVTSKLEGLFNSLKGIQEISSTSRKGSGIIRLRLKKETDKDLFRFELLNIIRQNYQKLPQEVSYPQISRGFTQENELPILTYTIHGKENSFAIKNYVEQHLSSKLSHVDGIQKIVIYGATPFHWVVTYNTDLLFQYQIGIEELKEAIDTYLNQEELGTATLQKTLESEDIETAVQLTYLTSSEISWEKIPIKKLGNRVLFLKDIATVQHKEAVAEAYYRINGLNALNLAIYANKTSNVIDVSKKVQQRITDLQPFLRSDYTIKKTNDASEFLIEELTKIQKRALFSVLVLLILTIVIYQHYKYLFVLFASILVNLVVAIIFYVVLEVQIQLYSLAGIAISFGIIIDNCIVMMDHLLFKKDKKVFLAILAATFTTISAVLIVFLLEENQRFNLLDFAIVIAINIGVSLGVAFYFVPALMHQLQLNTFSRKVSIRQKKRKIVLLKKYDRWLVLLKHKWVRWSLVVCLILGFGIPFHLLPEKIEHPNTLGNLYNKTLGSDWFFNSVKPSLEKYAGGAFRLFTEEVFEDSFYTEPQRTSIRIIGRMPEGCTVQQLNEAIEKMEHYLSTFKEIELFETQITSYRNSQIQVFFKDDVKNTRFPFQLKSLVESKAIGLGGLDWFISGVGEGFSNSSGTDGFGNGIVLEGYHYDDLYAYAELLKNNLLKQAGGRISSIEISGDAWRNSPLYEYALNFKPEAIGLAEVKSSSLFSALKSKLALENSSFFEENNQLQKIQIVSNEYGYFTLWDLKNMPLQIDKNTYKLEELASIEKRKSGNNIHKRNQQYNLTVAFNFTGSNAMAQKFTENQTESFLKTLPIGYRAYNRNTNLQDLKEKKQYYYLIYVIVLIFFVCAIVLNSLQQPFAVIGMIPISFLGVFLTFYLFNINFDQGGYASFILLAGISVNAALYLMNDLNNTKSKQPFLSATRIYSKAFRSKITPILVTILTTIFGLLPFLWSGSKEAFWFSFAAGSIGGLLFSLIGIFLYLPVFLNLKTKKLEN